MTFAYDFEAKHVATEAALYWLDQWARLWEAQRWAREDA
jgi:hypothetical protein